MTEPKKTLRDVIHDISRTLGAEHFPKGDLAELRRLNLRNPPPAYWRLAAQLIPEDSRTGKRSERAWAVVLKGMAIMVPHAHTPKMPLGRALCELKEKEGRKALTSIHPVENRLWTLLRSRGEQLEDQILLTARFLRSKESAMDWSGPAKLLLCADEEKRDAVCRELARGYYFSKPTEPEHTA